MKKVTDYVNDWMRHQALWDLQPDQLFERLGTDLSRWMQTLVEVKKARASIDTQETRSEIFPFIVDYNKVQSKVSMKYDYWHREVLQKFGASLGKTIIGNNFLGTEVQSFFGDISKYRTDLESQSVDSGNTSEAVALITYVQNLKKVVKTGQETIDKINNGQRLLKQQRFQFPTGWIYAEHVEGEWSALLDVLHRKETTINTQVRLLELFGKQLI